MTADIDVIRASHHDIEWYEGEKESSDDQERERESSDGQGLNGCGQKSNVNK